MRMSGMKSQDVVVLSKLVSLQQQEEETDPHGIRSHLGAEAPDPVRGLESQLGISKTEIGASFKRILSNGMAIKARTTARPKANRRNLYEFLVYGLRFVFPASPGAMTRGLSTAFFAPMLKNLLSSAGNDTYVWPDPGGRDIGQSVSPLFKSVPEAARHDVRLYEDLALVDAIRLGNQREAGLAKERLSKRLLGT